jgi:hypothetical protein
MGDFHDSVHRCPHGALGAAHLHTPHAMEQDHILTQDREPIRILGRESALVPRAQAVGPDGTIEARWGCTCAPLWP